MKSKPHSQPEVKNIRRYTRSQPSTTDMNGDGIKQASFTSLPTEILLIIEKNLDITEQAYLPLINHTFHAKLGTGAWVRLRDERSLPKFFLWGLKKDTGLDECVCCERLHPPFKRRRNELAEYCAQHTSIMCHQKGHRLWLSPKYFDVHVNYQRCFYRFKHQYLKAAMRRYRRGPKYGINPLSLAYLEINARFEGCTTMVAVEPRICENPTGEATFMLQVQGWVLFNYPDPHLRKRRLGIWGLDFVNVCADVSLSDIKMGPLLAEFLKEHDFTSKKKTVSRMFHCETCNLDFQIEVRNYARGPAVTVTRWIDLGQGLDATDPLWQAC